MNENTRMPTAEADARFDALVSQYRNEKKPRAKRETLAGRYPVYVALVAMYCTGIAIGESHARPLLAVVYGIFLVLLAQRLIKLPGDRDRSSIGN